MKRQKEATEYRYAVNAKLALGENVSVSEDGQVTGVRLVGLEGTIDHPRLQVIDEREEVVRLARILASHRAALINAQGQADLYKGTPEMPAYITSALQEIPKSISQTIADLENLMGQVIVKVEVFKNNGFYTLIVGDTKWDSAKNGAPTLTLVGHSEKVAGKLYQPTSVVGNGDKVVNSFHEAIGGGQLLLFAICGSTKSKPAGASQPTTMFVEYYRTALIWDESSFTGKFMAFHAHRSGDLQIVSKNLQVDATDFRAVMPIASGTAPIKGKPRIEGALTTELGENPRLQQLRDELAAKETPTATPKAAVSEPETVDAPTAAVEPAPPANDDKAKRAKQLARRKKQVGVTDEADGKPEGKPKAPTKRRSTRAKATVEKFEKPVTEPANTDVDQEGSATEQTA